MSGKRPHLSPLESRKQLLIAESELNRAQLLRECQAMTDEVHGLTARARSIASLASSAASLVTGLFTFRRGRSAPASVRSPGIDTLLRSVRLAASVGLAFRARGHGKQEDKADS